MKWVADQIKFVVIKNMKFRAFIIISLFLGTLALGSNAFAQDYSQINEAYTQLGAAAGEAGFTDPMDPRLIVANAIKLALGFIGTILFGLIVYSGYLWMTAGGNDDKISQAKTTIRNSTIGLIVILSAYGITIAATNLALGRNIGSGANRGTTLDDAIERAWFR